MFHRLNTSYADFHRYTLSQNIDFGLCCQFFDFKVTEDGLWRDFESDLGTFDAVQYFAFYNEVDVTRENFRLSEIYGLEDELSNQSEDLVSGIQEAFFEWIQQVDLTAERRITHFSPDDFFLSFNYTPLLESLYSVDSSSICHIHGCIHEHSELIFGHGEDITPEPEFDENGEPTGSPFSDAQGNAHIPLARLKKQVDDIIGRHNEFLEKLSDIDSIVVLGHSLGDVDLPYFKTLHESHLGIDWQVSYYRDDEVSRIHEQLAKVGVSQEQMSLVKIEELCH